VNVKKQVRTGCSMSFLSEWVNLFNFQIAVRERYRGDRWKTHFAVWEG
jgi:hypothetical protein